MTFALALGAHLLQEEKQVRKATRDQDVTVCAPLAECVPEQLYCTWHRLCSSSGDHGAMWQQDMVSKIATTALEEPKTSLAFMQLACELYPNSLLKVLFGSMWRERVLRIVKVLAENGRDEECFMVCRALVAVGRAHLSSKRGG